jgi:hypothetical protein
VRLILTFVPPKGKSGARVGSGPVRRSQGSDRPDSGHAVPLTSACREYSAERPVAARVPFGRQPLKKAGFWATRALVRSKLRTPAGLPVRRETVRLTGRHHHGPAVGCPDPGDVPKSPLRMVPEPRDHPFGQARTGRDVSAEWSPGIRCGTRPAPGAAAPPVPRTRRARSG